MDNIWKSAVIVAAFACALVCGCDDMNMSMMNHGAGTPPPTPVAAAPAKADPKVIDDNGYLGKSPVKSDAKDGEPQSAVESALAWSQRYQKVSDDLAKAQEENRDLLEKNHKLQLEGSKLQSDLASAQKELAEANQLLIEMRQDLDKWKSSVCGFQEEIRTANKAQLDATRKVIVLLGGEVSPSPATTQPAPAPAAAKNAVVSKGTAGDK
jgi:regulator of replication initiation timing